MRQGHLPPSVSDARLDRQRRAPSPTCRADKATIWSPTQSAYPTRNGVARCCSACRPENVRVIFTRGSGCYGINGADTVSYDAALLSQAVGKPVRVQLSRKDEMAWENYGFAFVDRSARRRRRRRRHRRVGLRRRGRRRSAAGPATIARATSITGHARRLRARAVHAAQRRRRSRPARSTTAATPRRRMWPAASAGAAAAPGPIASERVLVAHACSRRSSPVRCGRRRGCRTRSRTSRSWTRSRRT